MSYAENTSVRALLIAACATVAVTAADFVFCRYVWGSWPWQAGHATCERCRRLRQLARCVACERDLCRACRRVRTCAHGAGGEHRA